ncbi:Tim44-domain-containing protein [Tilletiaria anomala UBC 951]|uniref:Mitochondrial import inner membrane translocase subunit TIM44 n=1 Tax=Tilletiaria anomala (strain ATCC 24038 / CBS 436.72 / UBC 951) TaxID=1037660 RepID=A0A066VM65_TILAU|nr:Tim44-domain-containing protein [Tilletiaria anomala UBC 951]KDN41343.1 Tim44-domain-containing protein [Tilletiaria anomala UBC 951]
MLAACSAAASLHTARASPSTAHQKRPSTAIPNVTSQRWFSSSQQAFDAPRSPFTVFVETLKEELRKSRELQENVKQLQGDVGKIQDSEAMKSAKAAYERMRIVASIKENPRLQAAAEQLRKNGGQVSAAVGETLKQMEDSELIKGLSAVSSRLARQLEDSTAPIRNTEAYKAFSQTITEAFDDGGSALRIYADEQEDAKMVRKLKRETRLRKIGRSPPLNDVEEATFQVDEEFLGKAKAMGVDTPEEAIKMAQAASSGAAASDGGDEARKEREPESENAEAGPSTASPPEPRKRLAGYAVRYRSTAENPNAGEALVLRPEPAYKQAWSNFSENNTVLRRLSDLRQTYDESENPFIERLRGITETIGSWFEENETAQVVRQLRMMEPDFTLERFQRELREYVVPEFIDAYHGAQKHILRQWCGEATYNVLMATVEPFLQKGYIAEGRLLDLKGIEIVQGKMLENNIPVLVVSFSSQELMFFTDPKTGEIKAGKSDQTDLCRYAMVLTRVEEELDNEITGGWKVVELARRGQASFL